MYDINSPIKTMALDLASRCRHTTVAKDISSANRTLQWTIICHHMTEVLQAGNLKQGLAETHLTGMTHCQSRPAQQRRQKQCECTGMIGTRLQYDESTTQGMLSKFIETSVKHNNYNCNPNYRKLAMQKLTQACIKTHWANGNDPAKLLR